MIKLVAFDLDGTLTQHKTPLDPKNKSVLDRIAEKYSLLMLGAGQCRRIFNQLGGYPINIIGNYGLQYAEYDPDSKDIKIVRDEVFPVDVDSVTERIEYARKKYGFTEYKGKSIEFHPSGCVTFPIIGTEALIEDKLSFDPDRIKRRKIYDEICELFNDYIVFVGGSSSFDMSPRPYNKYYALDLYCKEHGLTHDEVAFVGDDYGIGGNDESVYKSDFKFICVDNYLELEDALSELL